MKQNQELFTIHSYKNGFLPQFRDHLQAAMEKANIHNATKRIVVSGKGVVILPDADRSQNCKTSELHKALHLTKMQNTLNAPTTKTQYMVEQGSEHFFIALTPEQERLWDWLYENGMLTDDVRLVAINDIPVEEI